MLFTESGHLPSNTSEDSRKFREPLIPSYQIPNLTGGMQLESFEKRVKILTGSGVGFHIMVELGGSSVIQWRKPLNSAFDGFLDCLGLRKWSTNHVRVIASKGRFWTKSGYKDNLMIST